MFQFDPFSLVPSYQVSTLAYNLVLYFVGIVSADSVLPAVQQFSFPNFLIPEDFSSAVGTFDGYHGMPS